jgi:UDP:flavonoid glycosyltransferase YjiC (YdhE family)
LRRTQLIAEEILNGQVAWAPVGPRVREQLQRSDSPPPLLDFDWHNVIDATTWSTHRKPPNHGPRSIGRHGRPDARKWPETREAILSIYPDDPRFLVRILGGGEFLKTIMGTYPQNWEVLPFNSIDPARFLQDLDAFVYYHHPKWIEAFGCAIAEAMASGLPCILPKHFADLFGEGALYAEADQAAHTALAICEDSNHYRRQSETAREFAIDRFGHDAHLRRVRSLIGEPRRSAAQTAVHAAFESTPPRRALFVSINGIGMGHLTRLLAIARRLPESVQPIFATMSQAIGVVREFGYLAEYLPFHEYLRCDIRSWNRFLAQELNEIIRFYDARVILFDGNAPFQGVIDAASINRHVWSVWCRRAMWQAGVGATFMERERHFDAVLEPRELAEDFDTGLTRSHRTRARVVDPIRLLDNHELLPRDAARSELGLADNRQAILVQLGSGNNFRYEVAQWRLLDTLRERHDVQIVAAEWLMAKHSQAPENEVRVVRTFPLSRYFRAFDASVSAVGYNSYHELVQAGLPTLYIPNENPRQDNQLARAEFAERRGFGLCVRAHEVYRLQPAIHRLLDPTERQLMVDACARFACPNGAIEAAKMIEELSYVARTSAAVMTDVPSALQNH